MRHAIHQTDHTGTCLTLRAHLDEIVAEAADSITVARAAAHADACPPCRVALASAEAYRQMMQRVGAAVRASDALRERVLATLHGERGSRPI
jgi:hypothetical protein